MSMPLEVPVAPEFVVRFDDSVPVICLPAELPFDTLRAWISDRIEDHTEAIGGRASRLDLGDRSLELFDLRRLVHHLQEQHELEITGIYATEEAVQRFAERELKLKLFQVASVDDEALQTDYELLEDEAPPPAELSPHLRPHRRGRGRRARARRGGGAGRGTRRRAR